ncbi:helix-turn-helix domain-containing protein [Streptomyces sp. PRKS01-65]|nr:helix-turn-helix domain-containing protein [Streptomyces harenosi]NEY32067.1 helix-turn-helix domain-containing protein [Streptomyces harenosi]
MARPKVSKGGLVTDEERAEIIRLHGEGKGRNEIARLTRRSQRTVSVICAEEGLTFDVTMTEEATRHRVAQLAERRAILAEELQGDAERLTEQMWRPAKVFNFGGKDNTYEEHDVDEPPADAKKNLMASAGIAIEKSLKLVPPDRDLEGLAAVDAWLRGMMPDQQ